MRVGAHERVDGGRQRAADDLAAVWTTFQRRDARLASQVHRAECEADLRYRRVTRGRAAFQPARERVEFGRRRARREFYLELPAAPHGPAVADRAHVVTNEFGDYAAFEALDAQRGT